MSTITTARHGSEAIRALHELLRRSRGDDILSPATVVVRTAARATYLRKSLAEIGGVAGVEILPTTRFVAKLAREKLASVGPPVATPLAFRAAIQAELLAAPGALQKVATHQSTLQRLVDLAATLCGVPRNDVERMITAAPPLSAAALRVVVAAERRLSGDLSPTAELEAALEVLAERPEGEPIILFTPLPKNPLEGRLLAGLAGRNDVHIIAAMSGVRTVDTHYRQALSGWGLQVPAASVEANPAIRLEVSDPEDEVQAALREVLKSAESGVPLAAMAVLYPSVDPYATICFQQLQDAGIPVSGPAPLTLESSVAARLLLRGLDLLASGLERSAVVRFMNCAPICDTAGVAIPAVDWDHISRRAGVIAPDSWQPRLDEYQRKLALNPEPSSNSHCGWGGDGSELLAFVAALEALLGLAASQKTWRQLSRWAADFLSHYLPNQQGWPDAERLASIELGEVLRSIGELDGLLPTVTPELFRSLLMAELERRHLRTNPYGSGLLVAHIDQVAGLAFERVIVLGAAEGAFPLSRREDPLLTDQLRSVVGNYLGPSGQSTVFDSWSIAAALSGSEQPGIVTFSRSELRSGRSRVWPQALDVLIGERQVIESHFQGVLSQGRPPGAEDFAIRELLRHVASSEPLGSHPLAAADSVLAAGLARVRARGAAGLTPHTGLVSAVLLDVEKRPFSPTALETYAACPRRYLLARVLRISEQERPERVEELSPRDRGSLLHKVLERFVGEALSDKKVPEPQSSWTDAQVTRLFEIASHEIETLQELGLSGGRVQTHVSHRSLNSELTNFVANDNKLRAEYGCTPAAVEYEFGFGEAASIFRLTDGRQLRIRGSVDRVDTTSDGGIVVIDYKTGSSRPYTQIESNPFDEGRRLQLPIYGSVVTEEFASVGANVAMYWMTREAKQISMNLGDSLEAELDSTVGDLLAGISAGYFPAVPGDVVGYPRVTFENCKYCEFDRICPQDRQREWSNAHAENTTLLEHVRGLAGA